MSRQILSIGLLSFCLISCTKETSDNSLDGSWKVFSFQNLTTGSIEFRTQTNSWNKEIEVTFNSSVNPKSISGINITNQFFGEFSYVGQNQFKVSNLESTQVNQPSWADEFFVAILDQNLTYKVASNRLVVYYNNKTKSMILVKG